MKATEAIQKKFRRTGRARVAEKVDPQIQQKSLRHSDIKLTLDIYTDSTLLKVSEAIMTLPAFSQDAGPCAGNLAISRQKAAQAGTNRKAPATGFDTKTKTTPNDTRQPQTRPIPAPQSPVHQPSRPIDHPFTLAASLGFEPRQSDSESLVLPLHYEAKARGDGESMAPNRVVNQFFPEHLYDRRDGAHTIPAAIWRLPWLFSIPTRPTPF